MSYSLNSLKGGYIGDYIGVIKGDTRSLDYSSDEMERRKEGPYLAAGLSDLVFTDKL